jgi:hypothetical protein
MRACACLAFAIVALAGDGSASPAERDASFSAAAEMAEVRSHCAATAVTFEDYANCLASLWPTNACSRIRGGYHDCIAGQASAIRHECEVHVVLSKYMDCVGIGENRIGVDWPGHE